jgi:hypothetical protein
MVHMVEHLPSNHKVFSSNPSTTQKKKKQAGGKEEKLVLANPKRFFHFFS